MLTFKPYPLFPRILFLLLTFTSPALAGSEPAEKTSLCARISDPDTKKLEEKAANLGKKMHETMDASLKLHKQLAQQTNNVYYTQAYNTPKDFLKHFQGNFTEVCKAREEINKQVSLYLADLRAREAKDQTAMCENFGLLEDKYRNVETAMGQAKKLLGDQVTKVHNKATMELVAHRGRIQSIGRLESGLPADKRTPGSDQNQLRKEFVAIWGDKAETQVFNRSRYTPNEGDGLFGTYLNFLRNDVESIHGIERTLGNMKKRMEDLKTKCATVAAGGEPAVGSAGDQGQADDQGQAGDQEQSGDQAAAPVDPSITQESTDSPGQEDPNNPELNINNAGGDPVPEPETPEQSWAAKNKGLLIAGGVGAAAVGGILLYKNHQDKKSKKDASQMNKEARALANAQNSQNTATSTSTVTNTTINIYVEGETPDSRVGGPPPSSATPQGSKLLISGIPAGAQMNSNITPIEVSVISPAGILTSDNGSTISVSCVAPVPCSLTGTLSATTSNGKARFNDLRFTQPDKGVKLQFAAPGFVSGTSSSGFDVSDPGASSGSRE